MNNRNKPTSQQGFTLIELLVALSIFAILGAITMTGLHSLATTSEHNQIESKRLAELAGALTIMERDLVQALQTSPFTYNPAESLLKFSSIGWQKPPWQTRDKQGYIKEIGYICRNGQLERLIKNNDSTIVSEKILTKVDKCQMRFFNKVWQDGRWPPTEHDKTTGSDLPQAVEFIVKLQDMGTFNRIFLLTGT